MHKIIKKNNKTKNFSLLTREIINLKLNIENRCFLKNIIIEMKEKENSISAFYHRNDGEKFSEL